MSPSLSSVSISNFRSINGTITVPLNAPVILVHGPNGSGKTSVLSAIELALTGEIAAMQRSDANYRSHLLHWGAENARIVIDGSDLAGFAKIPHVNVINADGMRGGALLSGEAGRFFSERCYLAQAALGRLLEIYQNASPREESALTRFVKDLLGLDALDALIDGLHPAGDIRNTRRLSPGYLDAETKIQTIERSITETGKKLTQASDDTKARRIAIRSVLTSLSQLPDSALGTDLPEEVAAILNAGNDDQSLIALSGYRRDLASLRQRALPLSATAEASDEAAAVTGEQTARAVADQWRLTTGKPIEVLIGELRETFPDLPSVASTDPGTAFRTAETRIEAELQRCVRTIAEDDATIAQLEKMDQDIEKCRARVALADEQLLSITGEAEGLSSALAAIIPHIHGNDCPVCGRDYHEVSSDPLVQHVSVQVARFAEQASRLQGLGRSRASALSEQSNAERTRETTLGKRLSQDVRGALKARISELTEAKRRLTDVAASVDAGASALRREAEAQTRLSEIRNRQRLAVELRNSLAELCIVLDQPPLETSETVSAAIQRLDDYVGAQEATANDRLRRRREAFSQYQLLREQATEIKKLEESIESDVALKKKWEAAFAIAEQHRLTAKALARAAGNTRTNIVGRVFNSSLNKIWRDLFVRLAPNEPFVPAFRLPQNSTQPVTGKRLTNAPVNSV